MICALTPCRESSPITIISSISGSFAPSPADKEPSDSIDIARRKILIARP